MYRVKLDRVEEINTDSLCSSYAIHLSMLNLDV
jgi:hypothetical protein